MTFRYWTVIEVACDSCDEVHDTACDHYSENDALHAAAAAGWTVRGDLAHCPTCAHKITPPPEPTTPRPTAPSTRGPTAPCQPSTVKETHTHA